MMVSTALLRTMRNMLPDALIVLIHERAWHSLTFAGAQICISITLSGKDRLAVAAEIADMLPTHEFDLPDQLIADIAIIETTRIENETRLLIDALVLED